MRSRTCQCRGKHPTETSKTGIGSALQGACAREFHFLHRTGMHFHSATTPVTKPDLRAEHGCLALLQKSSARLWENRNAEPRLDVMDGDLQGQGSNAGIDGIFIPQIVKYVQLFSLAGSGNEIHHIHLAVSKLESQ